MHRKIDVSRIKGSFLANWDLNAFEVEERRIQFGANDILEAHVNQWFELALETVKDPMIWFLVATSILFAVLKNYNQSIILLLATIPLICMDAFLHWRTQGSTRNLTAVLEADAIVIRNKIEMTISARDIVPGDLVVVPGGKYFPADGIIVGGENLQVDEAVLSGETFPVRKSIIVPSHVDSNIQNIEDCYFGFAGTRLLTGRALLRVVTTGQETLYGEIIASTIQSTKTKTPLQRSISRLVFFLIICASVICGILAVIRYYQGFGLVDALMSSATLAVAALPDEFPVVFTFFLGLGVYRLARRNALVRRSVSVENIGRVTCICSDKTGTITEGKLKLLQMDPAPGFEVQDLINLAISTSRLESGDPLDMAILEETRNLQIAIPKPLATFPFTEDRKRETSVCLLPENKYQISTKGMPEKILSISNMTEVEKKRWQQKIFELSATGHKVIACARLITETKPPKVEPKMGYQFAGLLVFSDPPRREVYDAVKQCISGGIHVLILTGDHPETARAIAKEIGLGRGEPHVILAENLKDQWMKKNSDYLRSVDVIARAIPSQKYAIVKSLQKSGEIVAVTGDGVNDVPALKAADIGIAMGERGTQSAREVADIVLLDDNFSSIVNAISEGRQLFTNLTLSFKYLLMIHMPFVISAALVPLLGYPLIYYPIHVVWIELFIHPTAMLVFQDLPQTSKLEAINHQKKSHFFSMREWFSIILNGAFTTSLVVFGFLFVLTHNNNTVEYARALAMAMLGLFSAAITFSLSRLRTWVARIVTLGTVLLTILPIQIPAVAKYLSLSPLSFVDWSTLFFLALLTLVLAKI